MRELSICECVGKSTGKSSKTGKNFVISYFTYELDSQSSQGLGTFSVFDDCVIGEQYNFIFANGIAQLIKL